jgi:RNA polymerase sigma factor (sigma-70 family)
LTEPETSNLTEVYEVTENLFREESARLVSVLAGIFGPDHLRWAEDLAQEALVRALRTWPYQGIPRNPAAWLTQTAKNLALDLIRRESLFRHKSTEIATAVEQWSADSTAQPAAGQSELRDDRLRLMFICCHPDISLPSQIALALKTLCGFSPPEIAQAFLTTEVAIEKRLTRARQKIRELNLPFELPPGEELPARLDAVLQTIYLLFNEGYKASTGSTLVRTDLSAEAVRLANLLLQNPLTAQAKVHALLALLLFNSARFGARSDSAGNLLRLKDQDRKLWDKRLTQAGIFHLEQSAQGDEISSYHLQAAIAACHNTATDHESTDWERILFLYDRLTQLDNSPIILLNRAVALAQVHGPEAGLADLERVKSNPTLRAYYLFHAVLAEFTTQLGRFDAAAKHFQTALRLSSLPSERAFLAARLREVESRKQNSAFPVR